MIQNCFSLVKFYGTDNCLIGLTDNTNHYSNYCFLHNCYWVFLGLEQPEGV
jgi:hypothetical protein